MKVIKNEMMKTINCENRVISVIKDENGKYWYKGKDICNVLGYKNKNGAMTRHLDKKYKKT